MNKQRENLQRSGDAKRQFGANPGPRIDRTPTRWTRPAKDGKKVDAS